ncbi:hypothetical protein FRC03_000451 [Tulasnella sp. 419]|nr:hypothetical protein FRC03_000451 [Tulasnella sp. 419]
MGQELELTRASTQEAENRYSKLKDDIGSYYGDWEVSEIVGCVSQLGRCLIPIHVHLATPARVLEDQQRSIASIHSELSTANATIGDKDRELVAIKVDLQDCESQFSTLRTSFDTLAVADQDVATPEAGIEEAKRSKLEADDVIDQLQKDFDSKAEEARNLGVALAPRASQEMALPKLQGPISDLRHALRDKNLCFDDPKSQIKMIKTTPAPVSDDRLRREIDN